MRADYALKRELLCTTLDECGLPCVRPEGSYYVLADVTGLGQATAREAAMEILERTRVACIPGTAFYTGSEGERLVRLCFAKEHDELEEACRRLRSLQD
jgi:aminotransferase